MRAGLLKHLGFIFIFLLWSPVLVKAEFAFIPPGTDLEKIFNKPAALEAQISAEEGDDQSKWIGMLVDIHVCTDIPQDVLRRVVTDYEQYTGIFKRLVSMKVDRADEGAYLGWHIRIGSNNLSYDTRYTTLASEQLNTRDKYLLYYSHVSDDGSIKDAWGGWYFENVMVKGKECTYVRYITSNKTFRKFLIQRLALSLVIKKEYADLMDQFLRAARTAQQTAF
ncbi:hypothetical protein FACS189485_18540 [Spirochaetia bacterium]|nr:hypothetical protein FACS189485_18540 [Spirochaetia bacterium]